MNSNNILYLLGYTKEDSIYVKGILESCISEPLIIRQYSLEEGLQKIEEEAIVLTTGAFLQKEAEHFFPNSKIIAAKRMITGQNIEKVLLLPAGTKVLVVSVPKEVLNDTVEGLRVFGLNHVELIPYWPNSEIDISDIDIAISPAETHLIPSQISTRIDLSRRNLSFSTFFELIEALQLDYRCVDNFARMHMRHMLDSGYKLAHTYNELATIIKNELSGIVSIDAAGFVKIVNPKAADILSLRRQTIIGRHYTDAFRNFAELRKLIELDSSIEDAIVSFHERKTLVSISVLSEGSQKTLICTLNGVTALQTQERHARRKLYEKAYQAKYTFSSIVGSSSAIKEAITMANKYAGNKMSVLIQGETGTGKELFAQSIHNSSDVSEGPFVAINFASIPESLIESELFGYEEGAFTGASKGGKAGLFEQAHGGTIFLDEICDAPKSIQSRLLRVIQEREVMRIGATKVIPVNVRIISATNKDLLELVKAGAFREDLYYRINVLPLSIPALRKRKEDIVLIAKSIAYNRGANFLWSEEFIECLVQHNWPGNVRELENVIKYLIVVTENNHPKKEDLLKKIQLSHSPTALKITENMIDDEMLCILTLMHESNNKGISIGWKRLLKLLADCGYPSSEAKIRTRLDKLRRFEYIQTGKTKQGSTVTDKGLMLLMREPNQQNPIFEQ